MRISDWSSDVCSSDLLARRTESQAGTLEETAAAMQQITVTVRQNADNAQEADRLAATARTNAERGGDVVSNVVSAMERIEDSARRIADIMGRSEEHTSELQSLMRISYAVFCLKKKKKKAKLRRRSDTLNNLCK